MRRAEAPEAFRSYLREVCAQVRWRRARGTVMRELLAHLEDQKAAFLEDGMDDAGAEAEAVRDMGDPVLVGKGMDGAYRPKRDWVLVLLVLLLTGMGVTVMVLGRQEMARTVPGLMEYYEESGYLLTYLPLWMGGGLLAFLLCYLSGPLGWLKSGWVLSGLYTAALIGLWIVEYACAQAISPDHLTPQWYYDIINACSGCERVLLPLAPVFGAVLLYRLHGTGSWGAVGFLVVSLLFFQKYGGTGTAAVCQVASVLLLSLYYWGICSGWFGGNTVKYRKWWLLVSFSTILLLGGYLGYLWDRANGVIYHFGRDGYYGWNDSLDLHWFGKADGEFNYWSLYTGDKLLLYAVYRLGKISVPVVLVVLLTALLRGIRDWERQKKWFGRTVSAMAVLTLGFTGVLELGAYFGLWNVIDTWVPLFCGGTGFVTSMALLGILLAVRRDAALIPGRRAERGRNTRLKAVGS